MFFVVTVSSFAEEAKFSLDDVPSIENKKTLTLIIETGDAHSKTIPAIEEFSKKTGVKVNVERIASSGVYGKENVEIMAGTGFYDLVYVETAWTTEWSDYLYKLKDLANKYDPGKFAALNKDLEFMLAESPEYCDCERGKHHRNDVRFAHGSIQLRTLEYQQRKLPLCHDFNADVSTGRSGGSLFHGIQAPRAAGYAFGINAALCFFQRVVRDLPSIRLF